MITPNKGANMKFSYYIEPTSEVFLTSEIDKEVDPNYRTQIDGMSYSWYNYLKPGIVSNIKVRHFDIALKMTNEFFHKCNVIDFGCADGTFLPSLSKYFNKVLAVDNVPADINVASKLIEREKIDNVKLICNKNLSFQELKTKLNYEKYHILYLLETLEHIGNKPIYESKIEFLNKLFELIEEDGIIVITVPNMIGISFFIQHVLHRPFGLGKQQISIRNLLKASFLRDTKDLERYWNGGHLGFNHEKMESYFKKEYRILKKKNIISQVVYIIQKN
jgi:2-polyprenyl-3-methyl-5-hydroxy-6-metoxy-1,4-benzoquinol methylase